MNETSNVGPRHYWIFNTRAGEDDLFNFIRSPEQYIPIRLFFFYEPSQYDMIHDRKNQTQASFFTRGANLSNPNIQLVKVIVSPILFPIESAFETYPAYWLHELDYMHHNEGIK